MKVLAPITVTDAILTSSTLAETEYAAWSSATTYAAAARVIYQHVVYESLQASNLNKTPDAAASATWWVAVGPTNRWAMFDGAVNTPSTSASNLVVVLTPGVVVDAVAVVAGVGGSVRVQMADGAASVYDVTQSLDSTPIEDWSDYFFADQVLTAELVFDGLPRYRSGVITVTVTPSGGVAQVGALVLGRMHPLGRTTANASAGITDYSRKETDTFGTTSLLQRSYAKRAQVRVVQNTREVRRVQQLLAGLRTTPAVWVGEADTDLFAALVVYGWFRSFALDIPGSTLSYCSLEIEGLA